MPQTPEKPMANGLSALKLRRAEQEIERLKQALADAHGLLVSYGKWANHAGDLAHDVELHFSKNPFDPGCKP